MKSVLFFSFIFSRVFTLAVISLPVWSASDEDTWNVRILGIPERLDFIQKRAHLKMARSIEFCSGFYMPQSVGKWSCQSMERLGKDIKVCTAQYKCTRINRSFNRLTETRKYLRQLKKIRQFSEDFKIYVAKKPLFGEFRSVSLIGTPVDIDELRKEDFVFASKGKEQNKDDKAARLGEKGFKPEIEEDASSFLLEETISKDGTSKTYKLFKPDKKEVYPEDKIWNFLAFKGALLKIADDTNSSLGTTQITWTPTYNYSNSLRFRAYLGGHLLKAVFNQASESFWAYDVGALMEYNLISNFFIAGGVGVQLWKSEKAETFNTLTAELGYRFFHPMEQVRFLDTIYLGITQVNNKRKNKELMVGLGIKF